MSGFTNLESENTIFLKLTLGYDGTKMNKLQPYQNLIK